RGRMAGASGEDVVRVECQMVAMLLRAADRKQDRLLRQRSLIDLRPRQIIVQDFVEGIHSGASFCAAPEDSSDSRLSGPDRSFPGPLAIFIACNQQLGGLLEWGRIIGRLVRGHTCPVAGFRGYARSRMDIAYGAILRFRCRILLLV